MYKTYNRQTETLRAKRPYLIEPCYIIMSENVGKTSYLELHYQEIGINLHYVKPISDGNIREIAEML